VRDVRLHLLSDLDRLFLVAEARQDGNQLAQEKSPEDSRKYSRTSVALRPTARLVVSERMAALRPEGDTTIVWDRRGPISDSFEIVSSAFCICATGSLMTLRWLSTMDRLSGSLPIHSAAGDDKAKMP
jgi:hypothetical protein